MNPEVNRNILIAVDPSENSRRAVEYVGNLLGDIKGFRATLLHVIREPEEDEFPDPGEKDKWYQEHQWHINRMLKEEFLFGSISGKIVRIARNCAVWVVE